MEINKERAQLTKEQIEQCIYTLESLNEDTAQIFEIPKTVEIELITQAGRLSRPQREEFKQRKKNAKKIAKRKASEKDKHARNKTGIRSARDASVFVAPKMIGPIVEEERPVECIGDLPRNCYVCKELFTHLHHFYDTMCEACGDFNYAKRYQTADMTDQVALVTGSRLKIGYHITLMMLRGWSHCHCHHKIPSGLRFALCQRRGFCHMGTPSQNTWIGFKAYSEC